MGRKRKTEIEEPEAPVMDIKAEVEELPQKFDILDRHKKEMLVVLCHCWPNIAEACRVLGISRQTFYNWKEADKLFAEGVELLHEARLDMIEEKVHNIALSNHQQSLTACIFLLNTQRSDRFQYSKKVEHQHEHRIVDPVDMGRYELPQPIDITEESEEIR